MTTSVRADYYQNCRLDVIEMLPDSLGRVLDVGCGGGATGKELLRRGMASTIDGFELDEDAATRAREEYRSVVVGDLERVDDLDIDGPYDTLLCNDVLEHLRDPWGVLRSLTGLVRPGGLVAVSIPNVQCIEVVSPLLRGRFEYADDGVLDRTHLRFFTRRSGRELVESADLRVIEERDSRVGASKGRLHQMLGVGLGSFGVRQLLYLAERPA